MTLKSNWRHLSLRHTDLLKFIYEDRKSAAR